MSDNFGAYTYLRHRYLERREGIPTMKTLAQIKDNECHYPLGDPLQPGFGYCGCKAMATKPYCFKHYRVMYPEPVEVSVRTKDRVKEKETA